MSGRALLGYALPADHAGWWALAASLAVVLGYPLLRRWHARISLRWWVGGCAVLAAGLSALWVWHYLRGGPRIIDATSYLLEARAMAHGMLSWPLQSPSASFRGRFLLTGPHAETLGVIFPPGYPAVLAVALRLGVPMALGPVLAAALVIVTASLAKLSVGTDLAARLAALISALCASLRYHTADTMSHGWAALCLACALCAGLLASRAPGARARMAWFALAGLCAGWLFATRPVSVVPLLLIALVAAVHAMRSREHQWLLAPRTLLAIGAGAALPVALLLAHQHAVTGRWFSSAQSAYYLLSDGPPGCFRYGFGRGVGCVVEHEPYVRSVLPDGFGLWAALVTTGRRVYLHLSDVANFEPLVLLVAAGVWMHRGRGAVAWLAIAPLGLVLAYAPFYFDASYPGAGARLLADALPAEHVLLAAAIVGWGQRAWEAQVRAPLTACLTAAVMLAGFGLRGSHQHALLRDRDGGRPLFDEQVARAAGENSLLFVEHDHAFNLAHDPSIRGVEQGRVVARARGGAHDRLLWERLGRPPAWRFKMEPWGQGPISPSIEPWSAPGPAGEWWFESEAEWPALWQSGGYAVPTWLSPASCVSSGVALAIVRTGEPPACASIEVPWPSERSWSVVPRLVIDGPARLQLRLDTGAGVFHWPLPERIDPGTWPGATRSPDGRWCVAMPAAAVMGERSGGRLTVCSHEAWIALDTLGLMDPT